MLYTTEELTLQLTDLYSELRHIARIMCQNDDDADDFVQGAYVKCLQQLDKFDQSKGTLKRWASVILRNHIRDTWNHEKSKASIVVSTKTGDLEEVDVGAEENDAVDYDYDTVELQLIAKLHVLLPKLTDGQREVLHLAYVDDMTDQAIASKLGNISREGVKERRRRALAKLRSLLSR